MKILKPEDMPAPDALIQYKDGSIQPAMFHYVDEVPDIIGFARDHGFEARCVTLESDDPDLYHRYGEEGLTIDHEALKDWRPAIPAEGFAFAGYWDTEDGPLCFYLKPTDGKGAQA